MDFIENFTIPFYTIQIDDWSIKKQKLLKICDSSRLTNNDDISKVYTDFFTDRNYSNQVYEILSDDISKFSNKVKITLELNSTVSQHIKEIFILLMTMELRDIVHYVLLIMMKTNTILQDSYVRLNQYGEFVEYTPDNVVEGTMIFFPQCYYIMFYRLFPIK